MASWKEENVSRDNPISSIKTGAMFHVSDLEADEFASTVPSTLSDRNLMKGNANIQGYDQEDEITISLLSPEAEQPQGSKTGSRN